MGVRGLDRSRAEQHGSDHQPGAVGARHQERPPRQLLARHPHRRPDQDNPLVVERFEREARLLARLESPHVVRFIAYGNDPHGRPCIALEWLEGEDLAKRLRTRPLSPARAVEVVRLAALGLHAIHEQGSSTVT